jgi:hypothetical protein
LFADVRLPPTADAVHVIMQETHAKMSHQLHGITLSVEELKGEMEGRPGATTQPEHSSSKVVLVAFFPFALPV